MASLKEMAKGKGRKDVFILAPEDIVVDPNWNERSKTSPRVKEHIARLADSIAEVGVKQAITIRKKGEEYHVTDGFCRMAAVAIVKERGIEIVGVPVMMEDAHTDEADHVSSMLIRNDGLELTTYEQAKVVGRLLDMGWDKEIIRKKWGRSPTHMNNLIRLLTAGPEVKKLLESDKVSTKLVLDTIEKHGPEKATNVINKAVEKAKATNKKKATKRTAGDGKKRANWPKHGPKLLGYLEGLFKAYDELEECPESIADALQEARSYIEEAKLPKEEA